MSGMLATRIGACTPRNQPKKDRKERKKQTRCIVLNREKRSFILLVQRYLNSITRVSNMKNIFKGEVIKRDVCVKGAWDRILSRAQ
jgi:hypothetical protein